MIGMDIGTTQSKAAFVDPTGKAVAVVNARGEAQTPSAVHYSLTGGKLVGTEAVEQGYLEPERCARNFKLLMGTGVSVVQADPGITPVDATAALIAMLKEAAERQTGMAISECVATCPANWRDDAKQALIEAFEQNGLALLKLLPEPTAAGLAYASDKASDKMTFAAYDFGGGTFDVSILRKVGAEVAVLATEGVPKLGGNDFNECICRRVLDAFEAKFKVRPDPKTDPLLLLDLDQKVERAKISLNTRDEVPVVLGYKGMQLVVKIRRDDFNADVAPLVQQSIDALEKAVKAAGLQMSQLDRLIMVGGTSNLRIVQEMVANSTGLMPRVDIDPIMAVAFGAAHACIGELSKQGKTATIKGRTIPSPDLYVRDVTAHSVGCCVVDSSGPRKNLIQSVIIPKNTPIPCQKTDCFFLEHDDQTEACIEILQGDADTERDKCLLIGDLTLTNLPREPKRTARIQVEYTINANGMVTAVATDKVSGKSETASVDYKKGIQPRQKPAAI